MDPSICIVTPGYLSSTPRVVKEADALQEAGMDVRMVHTWGGLMRKRQHDRALLRDKDWTVDTVRWSPDRLAEWGTYVRYTVQQRLAQWMPTETWATTRIAEQVQHRVYPALAGRVAEKTADLYIGHYPAGLAAAARGADRHDAQLGYDAEDFHVGQQPENQSRIERTDFIERRYLDRCAHVTAASEGIAAALTDRYDIDRPCVIHNMFPWAERETLDGETKDREGEALSVYWFSQTVGLNRGLQDALRAIGLLDVPVQLHIRGTLYDEVERELRSIAEDSSVAEQVYFHPQVPPDELLSRTAEHDVGLTLEHGKTPNRALCVTNKLFHYPLAGLAVAATDVPGQRRLLEEHPTFSGLYEPGDVEGLADVLRRWTDREALEEAKSSALEMARSRWNWEREKEELVDQVSEVIGTG
jgi:glycosyltransferase involved in cell wall biosynthesis